MMLRTLLTPGALTLAALTAAAEPPSPQAVEFFESRIRPVLVEHCYDCHRSGQTLEGGLAVDTAAALRRGGDSGRAVIPGRPDQSLLLQAMQHTWAGREMPHGGDKLPDAVLADFARWIADGAVFPAATAAPTAAASAGDWAKLVEQRRQWWSYQPIARGQKPPVGMPEWSEHSVDRFIAEPWRAEGLRPAADAEPRTQLRRLAYLLTGLPPTLEALAALDTAADKAEFLAQQREKYLASPAFGERWARHLMDWFRFAESHGSEGDPAIPNAWHYRDYLIRALNDDVPYDRLIHEHLAGDLIPPRLREGSVPQQNESVIGLGHLRMVFHGFNPTDALLEQVRFTDDQVNVVSKAFLGMTVSCARCHDHKFDPISQREYYSLYGTFAAARPAMLVTEAADAWRGTDLALAAVKPLIRQRLAERWKDAAPAAVARLDALDAAAGKGNGFADLWRALANQEGPAFTAARQAAHARATAAMKTAAAVNYQPSLHAANDRQGWARSGPAFADAPAQTGAFALHADGPAVVQGIYPAGGYSHLLSSKVGGTLLSPPFTLTTDRLSVRTMGADFGQVRLVIRNYPIARGGIYNQFVQPIHQDLRWTTWDTSYWRGEQAHVEVAPFDDLMFFNKSGNGNLSPKPDGRSAIGITEVVGHAASESPPDRRAAVVLELLGPPATTAAVWRAHLVDAIRRAVAGWAEESLTDAQAELLQACLDLGLLPNTLADDGDLAALVDRYRKLEATLPVLTRVPGVIDCGSANHPIFVRGNHRQPTGQAKPEPLTIFAATTYDDVPPRLALARGLTAPANPLTARVVVNRVWHHLFGEGLVRSPDNLGRLGEAPTHRELLDYLADRFTTEGWSLKTLIRELVGSRTWRQSSRPADPERTAAVDADNRLWSRIPVRRLEAEAIRDSLLTVAGRLEPTRFGPPVDFRASRRSIYVRVQRNNLDPFARTFDFPEPASTVGRREVTNVPAQSLTLLNDGYVAELARSFAERVGNESSLTSAAGRIERAFRIAFARPATAAEIAAIQTHWEQATQLRQQHAEARSRLQAELVAAERARDLVIQPVYDRLRNKAGDGAGTAAARPPAALARWRFDTLRDQVGTMHLAAKGNARVESGILVVDGASGYAESPVLAAPLAAKTLEVWVRLADLEQRGGGAMTVQTVDGAEFDSVVFGEQAPRQWLAGSDHFRRTKPFGGPVEDAAVREPVQVVLAFHPDGTIAGFRNGQPYGQAYRSDGLKIFSAGSAQVVFGLRHAPAGGNRLLRGGLLQAALYDRALTAAEVAAAYGAGPAAVSEAEVRQALSAAERESVDRLAADIAATRERLAQITPVAAADEASRWADLCHALINAKEFIYLP